MKQYLLPIILIAIISVYTYFKTPFTSFLKRKRKLNNTYKNWKKISIPSSKLKVIRADYYEEVQENYSPRAAFWSMAAGHTPSPKSELITLSYFTYSDGKQTYQSQALKLDQNSVLMALINQGSIDLYIKDKEVYQFDVDFLFQV